MSRTSRSSIGAALLAAAVLSSCRDATSPAARPSSASIAINPAGGLSFSSFGGEGELTASVTDEQGRPAPGAVITWTSSDSSVAFVVQGGDGTTTLASTASGAAVRVRALANGASVIRATWGAASADVTVNVTQRPATLTIDPFPLPPLPFPGDTVRISATVADARGNVMPDQPVQWSSPDSNIAFVVAAGGGRTLVQSTTGPTVLAQAVGSGVAAIVVTAGPASRTEFLDTRRVAVSLSVSPSRPDTLFSLGDTVRLTATVLDARGGVIPGSLINWTAPDDVAFVQLGPVGQPVAFQQTWTGETVLVWARANGSFPVTASVNSVTTSVVVNVRQKLAEFSIRPQQITVASGGRTFFNIIVADARGNTLQPLPALTYASTNTAVATVGAACDDYYCDYYGPSYYVNGVSPGLADVIASVTTPDGTREAQAHVTVTAASASASVTAKRTSSLSADSASGAAAP